MFCSQTSDKDELVPVSQDFYAKQMCDTALATFKVDGASYDFTKYQSIPFCIFLGKYRYFIKINISYGC